MPRPGVYDPSTLILILLALLFAAWGTVTIFICFNANVMDYIARHDLGKSETLRLRCSSR